VEAELSDWLIGETEQGNERTRAEEVFNNYDHVEVKVKRGRFTKLCGPEEDVNRLELDLMRTYMPSDNRGGISELSSSDSKAVNGHHCIAYWNPLENAQWQQEQQQHEDELFSLLSAPHSVPTSAAGSSHDQISPAQRYHSEPPVRDGTTEELHCDEMDVEEYVWSYMLFKYADLLEELTSKFSCNFGLRPSSLDVNGKIQHRLQVKALTQTDVTSAYEKLAGVVVKLTEDNVMQQNVELCPRECFDELKQELQKNDILLMSTECCVVGPASALEAAQAVVRAAVNEIFARKSPLFAVSIDDPGKDIFTFHIPVVGLTVHVRQGIAAFIFLLAYLLIIPTFIYHKGMEKLAARETVICMYSLMAWFATDWFSSHHTVRCAHELGYVTYFIIVACRISL